YRCGVVLDQVEGTTHANDKGGCQNARPKNATYHHFQFVVRHRFQIRPVTPLRIISMASSKITVAKTLRKTGTLTLVRILVPSNAPANTPNMTGIATPGTI